MTSLTSSYYCIRQLNELKQSQQKLLADKEEETTARLADLDFAHECKLSGNLIIVIFL